MRFYLGGPINGCTDEEAHGWREEVKALLAEHGHTWADPMDRDYRGHELEPDVARKIVDGDKADIRACDFLLMNCPRPTWGTAMEILYGASHYKRMAVVMPEGETPSPWIIHHADIVLYGSVVDAVRTILPGIQLANLNGLRAAD